MSRETKATAGPWEARHDTYHDTWSVESDTDNIAHLWQLCEETHHRDRLNEDEARANALLMAEAGTVLHETGLTPRELSQRVKQLEHERSTLAGAIVKAAADLGIVTEVGRGYTGPEVLLLLETITSVAAGAIP